MLVEQHVVSTTRLGPRLAVVDHVVEDSAPKLLHDHHLGVRVVQRVLRMVESPRHRIRSGRVLVGGVDEVGLTGTGENVVGAARRVAVGDGPGVVGTDGGRRPGALDDALAEGDVHGKVVHHRRGDGTIESLRVHLLVGEELGALEVVTEAERVSDLVHDHFLEKRTDELFGHPIEGLDTVGVQLGTHETKDLGVHPHEGDVVGLSSAVLARRAGVHRAFDREAVFAGSGDELPDSVETGMHAADALITKRFVPCGERLGGLGPLVRGQ